MSINDKIKHPFNMDSDKRWLIAIFVPTIVMMIVGLVIQSTMFLVFTIFFMGALSLGIFFVFAIRSIKEKESVVQTPLGGVQKVKGVQGRLYGIFYLFIAITITILILSMVFDNPIIDGVANFLTSIFYKFGLVN